jgi:uncharacterized damage-inducible protein DinB
MSIAQMLLPEFDQEMAGTRKMLERVPEDKLDWKVHEKSNTIGWVANHLVEIAAWTGGTFNETQWDLNPPGGPKYETPNLRTRAELLEQFDRCVAEGRAALEQASDSAFSENWSLLDNGTPLFTMPRLAVYRTFIINHLIHHRGHLCVYYRLNDVPVPALYGPSGDEQWG